MDRPRPPGDEHSRTVKSPVLDSRPGGSLFRVCLMVPGGGGQGADGKVIVIALYASCNHKTRKTRLFLAESGKFSEAGFFVTKRA